MPAARGDFSFSATDDVKLSARRFSRPAVTEGGRRRSLPAPSDLSRRIIFHHDVPESGQRGQPAKLCYAGSNPAVVSSFHVRAPESNAASKSARAGADSSRTCHFLLRVEPVVPPGLISLGEVGATPTPAPIFSERSPVLDSGDKRYSDGCF